MEMFGARSGHLVVDGLPPNLIVRIVVDCFVPCVCARMRARVCVCVWLLTEQVGQTYIAASYVKYLEMAGARVVPIHYKSSSDQLAALFKKINGILFPGGGMDLRDFESQYMQTVLTLWKLAKVIRLTFTLALLPRYNFAGSPRGLPFSRCRVSEQL